MDLKHQIEAAALELFGKSFEFREWQAAAVEGIVESVLSNTKHVIMEAPTGSGKSITAIIAAYTLHKFYAKTSYILVSDLSLFEQYENDIAKLNVHCFGCLKGKDNYICPKNSCGVSQSACSLAGVSISSLMSGTDVGEFDCSKHCRYICDYRKAVNAPITLMTYQLYYIQRNYVEDSLLFGNNKNFPKRDLTICDECHNICNICQMHFSPTIDVIRPKWMTTLDQYMNVDPHESARQKIVRGIMSSTDNSEMLSYVNSYANYISRYCLINESLRKRFSGSSRRKLSKADKNALMAGNRARQEHCKFDDLRDFVFDSQNANYVVRNVESTKITLNFIYDDRLLNRYFHSKTGCELLMSATIGDFNEFARLTGLDDDNTNAIRLPSTFDFSNSPILYSTADKMTYASKAQSIPKITANIIDICRTNSAVRGIIQTGNYENSEFLANSLPPDVLGRCIFYRGSAEKTNALHQFLHYGSDSSDNHILVGPTLLEGLNFPDGLCRFQICMKIPYAHLGSEYIRKKRDLIEGWYAYDAITKICQGIGRGIRHKDDWCKTYILDGCVSQLFSQLKDIPTLKGRFQKM